MIKMQNFMLYVFCHNKTILPRKKDVSFNLASGDHREVISEFFEIILFIYKMG